MPKSILILGGSHSETVLIEAAKKLNLKVFTTGNRPEHLGHQYSDKYFSGDFSNFDEMLEIAKRSKCDYICAGANDFSYLSACHVAEKIGFHGFDSLEIAYAIHHKHLFKPIASSIGLPTTRFKIINLDENIDFSKLNLRLPLVIKPVDLTGGKGISKVNKFEDLKIALDSIKMLTKQKFAVIEEYFEGSLHSYSTIIEDGKVVFQYADNEHCYPNPYLVSASTSLASVPIDIFRDLKFQSEKFAKHLNLKNGVLHCQFIYSLGEYVILEFTRRCSGDLYSSVVQHVTGFNHGQQFIRQSMGHELTLKKEKVTSEFVSRHCIFSSQMGSYQHLKIAPSISKHIILIKEAFAPCYEITKANKEKMAVVLLKFSSHSEMLNTVDKLESSISCVVA